MQLDALAIGMRWLHIVGAVAALGAAISMLMVVLPAMHSVPEESRPGFAEATRRRLAMILGMAIVALLASGFFNYLRTELPRHRGQGLYHGLMGLKIALAFVIFFLGSVLAGRSPAFEGLRRRRRKLLRLNVALGLLVLAIAAVLRAIPEVQP